MATIQPFGIFFQIFFFVSETFPPLRSLLLEVFLCLGDQYTPKSQAQNSFGSFTVETIQRIALPKYGYYHYTNRLSPLEQFFHEVQSASLR